MSVSHVLWLHYCVLVLLSYPKIAAAEDSKGELDENGTRASIITFYVSCYVDLFRES